jgi:hypothetical protein
MESKCGMSISTISDSDVLKINLLNERMKGIAILLFGLSTLLTIVLALWFFRTQMKRHEGFQDGGTQPPPQANISQIMATIRRLASSLSNLGTWKERIALAKMTPVELARMHLKSTDKAE